MNILVIGCDQVGASLVRDLERIGHDISIIEKDSEQLKRLDAFDDYSFGVSSFAFLENTAPSLYICCAFSTTLMEWSEIRSKSVRQ
mgnify:CR=1 FL=1